MNLLCWLLFKSRESRGAKQVLRLEVLPISPSSIIAIAFKKHLKKVKCDPLKVNRSLLFWRGKKSHFVRHQRQQLSMLSHLFTDLCALAMLVERSRYYFIKTVTMENSKLWNIFVKSILAASKHTWTMNDTSLWSESELRFGIPLHSGLLLLRLAQQLICNQRL